MIRALGEHLRAAAVAYAVLLASLLLTVLAWGYVRQNVARAENLRFEETTEATRRAIDRRMVSYLDAMRDGRGLFAASRNVSREEWGRYVEGSEIVRRYPGMQAIGYARRVDRAGREALVRRAREEGFAGYEVRPDGGRPEYFPLFYTHPLTEPNKVRLGYDAYTEPEHRAAMDAARDSGSPRATGKVYVLSEAPAGSPGDFALEPGFVVYLPVYRDGSPAAEPSGTVAERRRDLRGFVVSTFRADALLRGIFGERVNPKLDLEVYENGAAGDAAGAPSPADVLYDDDGVLRAGEGAPARVKELDVAGRSWSLHFAPLPGFEEGSQRRLPLFVLLSGVGASLLLFLATLLLARSRARAERAGADLEEANRELEATNRELEAFSYSVSHDLRAPLRTIDGFSQILLEDYADRLDEVGVDYFGRIRAASVHMGDLIDDLLDLSRVGRRPLRREPVDLSALATGVAEELRRAEPDREVDLRIEEGVTAWGDMNLLKVALENLLGNAWKFTSKRPKATISFGVVRDPREGGRPVYRVRDDGAGFDEAYADKLFGAFQRLHGPEEFEGTGIGLATVARIVHRHGGRVWAEGRPGEGASFFFTLGGKDRTLPEAQPRSAELA